MVFRTPIQTTNIASHCAIRPVNDSPKIFSE